MSPEMHPAADDVTCTVRTTGLSRRYGERVALEGVDLLVPAGAVYVLVGENGAGKSTTLKLLMNLEPADAGTAFVLGFDASRHGPDVRARIGYVPEGHDPGYRWMRAARLLAHVAAHYPSWDHAYATHLSAALDLRLTSRVATLSKGESRRLQLALALAHRPPVLLLDEPTDGLDPVVRRRVLALLAEHLADTPTTVLLSTHHVHEVESLADHVGVLRGGRLVAQLARDDVQRTVRAYRIEVPEGWESPRELRVAGPAGAPGMPRAQLGRERRLTIVGEEREVTARLASAGARVHDVQSLRLEDAVLAFLEGAAA